jgi:hypothetical protein
VGSLPSIVIQKEPVGFEDDSLLQAAGREKSKRVAQNPAAPCQRGEQRERAALQITMHIVAGKHEAGCAAVDDASEALGSA